MRWAVLVMVAGCGFRPAALNGGATDAPIDVGVVGSEPPPEGGMVTAALCAPQTGLAVCYSFDASAFVSPMANEGSASTVTAQLTNVTRVAKGNGAAAQVDTTSKIFLPPNAELMGIASVEAWFHLDVDPLTGGNRIGILDADATSSALSLFYYQQTSGVFQIRFEIGTQLFIDHTITHGVWIYVAEVCDAGTLTAYVDGAPIGSKVGCSLGNGSTYGLMFGANNLQGGNADSQLTGAIDGMRLWTTPRSASEICTVAGTC
jgi:hypothetical protein